jgi:CheY-like chemotaxis protein
VLIVDDDELSRYLVRQVLRQFPCSIVEAVDGYEALQLVHEHKPDLITLDLGMPGFSGMDVLDELRADPATSEIPVVVITSKLLSAAERDQLAARTDAVLNKSMLGDAPVKLVFADLIGNTKGVIPG